MKHKTFLKNFAVISAGGLIAKAIGALYRIPLMGSLGGYGMGLYQMAYPLFCFMLTFSSAGIPSAFSRIIASETARSLETRSTLKTTFLLFLSVGLGGTALMCILAPVMASAQGDSNLVACYFSLAPAVALVAVLAVLRGYFQGKNDMTPTAVSEIVEQLVKVAFGLFFAVRHQGTVHAVTGTLFAVTLSEAAALIFLFIRLFKQKDGVSFLRTNKTNAFSVFSSVLPVMVAAAVLPLSQTIDSILIVRLMPCARTRAVSLYGLFAGGAIALINLPATVCYGLVAATVPAVSTRFARGDEEGGRNSAVFALLVTLALAGVCAVVLFAFARTAVSLLYPSLSPEDAETLVSLIRLMSVSAVTLSGVDTLTACLTGMGRAKKAAFSMLVAVLLKTGLQFLLIPALATTGAAIAANACYMIAFFLDLVYTVKKDGRKQHDNDHRAGNGKRRSDAQGVQRFEGDGKDIRSQFVARIRRAQRRRDNL